MIFLIINGMLVVSAYASLVAKTNRCKCFCGILTAVLSVVSLLLFLYLQESSGGPDYGQIIFQRVLPLGGYSLMFLLGLAIYLRNKKPKETTES
ncbi:MAG: hypothetical protein J6Q53_08210 [Oscillospiraceae bacterium]|nr:hypothetical protein [Oscillospiraceae bacterium]